MVNMKDMFGNELPITHFRGQHKYLNDTYFDAQMRYQVKKFGDYYLEKQIHAEIYE